MESEKNSSSFAIALEPEFDKDNNWTGGVTAYIEESIEDDLTEEQVQQIRAVCGLVSACLPLMEQDEDFLEYVKSFFFGPYEDLVNSMEEEESEGKPNFTKSKDGKVITLDFSTKTYGNA